MVQALSLLDQRGLIRFSLRVRRGAKKVTVPSGTCTYRAIICCPVASLPMAMAMTMPPPTVTVSPINLPRGIGYIVREAGTREKLGHERGRRRRAHSCGYPLANRPRCPTCG